MPLMHPDHRPYIHHRSVDAEVEHWEHEFDHETASEASAVACVKIAIQFIKIVAQFDIVESHTGFHTKFHLCVCTNTNSKNQGDGDKNAFKIFHKIEFW